MQSFDHICIEKISKRDILLILKALEYTFEKTNINEFLNLRDTLVEDICILSDSTPSEFWNQIEKEFE